MSRILCLVLALLVVVGATPARAETSALVAATRAADVDRVRELLRQGVAVDEAELDGSTALHWASYGDDVEMVAVLIDAGADANAANDLGATPLWAASQNGSVTIVRALLDGGADPDAALLAGETPIMVAARSGHAAVVDLLASRGADVDTRATRDQTALMWATSQGHPTAVEALLAHGADVHLRSAVWGQIMAVPPHSVLGRDFRQGGNTALLFAARSGEVESARLLLDAGADVDDTNAWGISATAMAAHTGFPELVELLLARGADADAAVGGFAPLHAAVMRRDERMVRALVTAGADPNVVVTAWTPKRRASADHNFSPALVGATPFWLAARFAEPTLMRLLSSHGADPLFVHDVVYQQDYRRGVAARPHEVTTAVMAATGMGGDVGRAWIRPARTEPAPRVFEAVRMATELGVDVNAAGPDGNTALHTAAMYGYDDAITYLVEHGARLDVENADGETPLVVAQARGRGGFTVELLMALAERE